MKTDQIERRLDLANTIARRSGIRAHWTGAVIFRKNSLVSHGWSHYTTKTYAQYHSTHAELHAVLRASRDELPGSEIYISTVRPKTGRTSLSKPCKFCYTLLYEAGITRAYYSLKDNGWEVLEIGQSIS